MADLFGVETPDRYVFRDGKVGRRGPRGGKHYVVPRGYAAPPGTGPAGETCKSCTHRVVSGSGKRRYQKCGLNRAKWTGGPGSDILVKSAACKKWEKAND